MIRVYLVEDQGMIREMLQIVLETGGEIKVVGAAPDAEQALIELESLDTDVVLMDVQLPGINGVEAVRRLKETGCDIPVIMLSAKGQQHDIAAGIEKGVFDYITKPFNIPNLAERIEKALASIE